MKQGKASIKETLGIDLFPAGKWKFNRKGNEYKKEAIDANRRHKTPWLRHTGDNMAKFAMQDTPYIVVDVDGELPDGNTIQDYLPSVIDTAYSQTTAKWKRHYYMLPPEGVDKELFRVVKWKPDGVNELNVDVLSTGTLFECHGRDLYGDHTGCYEFFPMEVKRFSQEDWVKILPIIAHYKTTEGKKQFFFNSVTANAVMQYLGLDPKQALTVKKYNDIVRWLLPDIVIEDPKKRVNLVGKAKYMLINGMAYLLWYNNALDTQDSLKFLLSWLKDEFGVDVNSLKWRQRLYKNILPNLPEHKKLSGLTTYDSLYNRLNFIAIGDETYIKAKVDRDMMFLVLDNTSLEVKNLSNESPYYKKSALADRLGMPMKHFTEFALGIPEVRIENDPYKDDIHFDPKAGVDCYNLASKTEYEKRAVACSTISPDNILRKVIESYCGEAAPFYYAWLAMVCFGESPPSTIFLAVSEQSDKDGAGTGKTTLANGIPSRLLDSARQIKEQDMGSQWGQVFLGARLITINDAKSPEVWKKEIYGTVRDLTTNGIKKQFQLKYGGFLTSSRAVGFAMSCNFIPERDEHDRRLYYQTPAFLSGKSRRLAPEEARHLNDVMEHTSHEVIIPEFQELMNYLKWVEAQKTFVKELTIRAPETEAWENALYKGKGFGSILHRVLASNPAKLFLMMDYRIREGSFYLRNEVSLKAFLKLQVTNGVLYAPYRLLGNILAGVQGDTASPKTSPEKIAVSMGFSSSKFFYPEQDKVKYKDRHRLGVANLPPRLIEWETLCLPIQLTEEAVKYYKDI